MTADLSALLDRLEAAAAAATPGPWLSGAADGAVAVTRSTAEHDSHDGSTFALLLPGPEVWNPTEAMANALLVAEMRHALPTLVAELRAHQAAVQAVRELADVLEADRLNYRYAIRNGLEPGPWDRIRAAVAALDPKEQD